MNGVLADFYSWLYQIPLSGYIRFRYITFLGISDSVISVSVISDSTFVISYSVISNSNLVISDSLYQSPLYQNLLYQKDHPQCFIIIEYLRLLAASHLQAGKRDRARQGGEGRERQCRMEEGPGVMRSAAYAALHFTY